MTHDYTTAKKHDIMTRNYGREEVFEMLGRFVRVSQMKSNRTGRPIADQLILKHENGEVFQSYKSIIGARIDGQGYFFTSKHDYSNTTSKYCTEWSGYDTKSRRDGLMSGKFGYIENEE